MNLLFLVWLVLHRTIPCEALVLIWILTLLQFCQIIIHCIKRTSKIFFSGRCFEDYHFGHTKANFFFAQVYYNFYARSSFKKTNSLHIMLNLLSLSKLAGNLPCDQWILWERWSYLVNSFKSVILDPQTECNPAQYSILPLFSAKDLQVIEFDWSLIIEC